MKVWIVAKTKAKGSTCVHGLTEENHNIRLLQHNGSYPSAHTTFAVGQVWDLTFHPSPSRTTPHMEDVLVTRWHQLDPEPNLRASLLGRITPWRGSPDQLFAGKLRSVMNTHNVFLSERDTFPPVSMGYWLPDAPLITWHGPQERLCYRYCTPKQEVVTDYLGFDQPLFEIPAHTLVHVALYRWWTPSNDLAVKESSHVERRCYLSIAGWYT